MAKEDELRVESVSAYLEELLTTMLKLSKSYTNLDFEENEVYISGISDYNQAQRTRKDISKNSYNRLVARVKEAAEDLREITGEFDKSTIKNTIKMAVFADIMELDQYEEFSIDSIMEHYNYYKNNVSHIFDLKLDSGESLSRGYLENSLLSDIHSLSEKDKKEIRNFDIPKKEILKEVSLRMDPEFLEDYFQKLTSKTFKPFFTDKVELDDKRYYQEENDVYVPSMHNKTGMLYSEMNMDNIIHFAKQLQMMREILSARPWYNKLNKNYRTCKAEIERVEEVLVSKGADRKSLHKFVNATGYKASKYLDSFIDKSTVKLNNYIDANKNSLEEYNESLTALSKEEKEKVEIDLQQNVEKVLDKLDEINFEKVDVKDEVEVDETSLNPGLLSSNMLHEEKSSDDELFHLDEKEFGAIEKNEDLDLESEDLIH